MWTSSCWSSQGDFMRLSCLCFFKVNTMRTLELGQTCEQIQPPTHGQWRCSTEHFKITGQLFLPLAWAKSCSWPININWTGLGCRDNLCKFTNCGLFTSKQFVDEVSGDSGPRCTMSSEEGNAFGGFVFDVWETTAKHSFLFTGDTRKWIMFSCGDSLDYHNKLLKINSVSCFNFS